MKANSCSRTNTKFRVSARLWRGIGAIMTTALVAACIPSVEPPTAPPPPPAQPRPAPQPPAPPADWRDYPVTPGTWRWSMTPNGSTASFGGGLFVMRCDYANRTVELRRDGASSANSLTIVTTTTTRAVAARPIIGGRPTLVASLPAHDSLLDAMAFSRGRFVVMTSGLATLALPSWPEITRVIEDCR